MARKQVLVQLEDSLVRDLDRLATQAGVSRSELLRRAAWALLQAMEEAEADRKLVESYKRIPQEAWIAAGGRNLASQLDIGPPPPE